MPDELKTTLTQAEFAGLAMQEDKSSSQTTDFDREFEVNGAIAILRERDDRIALLRSAYDDAISALRYIRLRHGDLYGVGWSRLDETYAKVYPDD